MSFAKTREELKSDGIDASRQALSDFWKRYQTTKSLKDAPRSGRPSSMTDEGRQYVDNLLEDDDELTSRQIKILLETTLDIKVCESTVRRILREELEWVVTLPKYCQTVREPNRVKRLEHAKKLLADNEKFEDVIFTDESTIEMSTHKRICRRKKGQARKPKPKVKHPLKLHVWGGISKTGASKICIFSGIMNSTIYTEILRHHLLPFIADKFPESHRFMQDNDPKHASYETGDFLEEQGVNWWHTPPESPDLNPIEMVWNELKRFIEKEVKPFTKEELVQGIKQFWGTRMTPTKCQKYIGHIHKVIPKVIAAQGGPSGE